MSSSHHCYRLTVDNLLFTAFAHQLTACCLPGGLAFAQLRDQPLPVAATIQQAHCASSSQPQPGSVTTGCSCCHGLACSKGQMAAARLSFEPAGRLALAVEVFCPSRTDVWLLQQAGGAVSALACSEGQAGAGLSSGHAACLDARTGCPSALWRAHQAAISALAFVDSCRVLTASQVCTLFSLSLPSLSNT